MNQALLPSGKPLPKTMGQITMLLIGKNPRTYQKNMGQITIVHGKIHENPTIFMAIFNSFNCLLTRPGMPHGRPYTELIFKVTQASIASLQFVNARRGTSNIAGAWKASFASMILT